MRYIPEELYNQIKRVIPIPNVNIIVISGESILFLKRQIEPLKGYWLFPAGRIEKGETPQEAAARELKEETGIIAEELVDIGTFCYFHKERQDIATTYIAKVSSKEVKLDFEHSEYKWLPKGVMPRPIHEVTLNQIMEATKKEKV